MPPEFLNSREDALLLWATAILAFVLYKNLSGMVGAVLGVLRALVQPKLVLLFGSALMYTAVVVYVARELGGWHPAAFKVTIYWFIGTAIVLVGDAVTDGGRGDLEYLRKAFGRILAVAIVVEFVVGVYAMPLAVEIVVVGVALVFSGMRALSAYNPAINETTRKFINGVLVAVALLYLGYFAAKLLDDPGGFATRENAEDFLVPLALTVFLLPFLVGAAWLSRREQDALRKRFEMRHSHG